MQVLVDGKSADPAMMNDWIALFETDNISSDEAFQAIEKYLSRYMNNVVESPEWNPLIEIIRSNETRTLWNKYVQTYIE